MKQITLGILGIGGVGGYFGALLAEHYKDSAGIRIIFLARQSTAEIIKHDGLKIISPEGTKIIRPHLVTSDAYEASKLDYLLCCTKTYDLEESIEQFRDAIDIDTIILPLQNGVDSSDRIQKLLPGNVILEGCVYIVAKQLAPGVVEKSGKIESLYFGSGNAPAASLQALLKIFKDALIDAYTPENIRQTVWEKFIFISCVASITSYLDLSIGQMRENDTHMNLLNELLNEVCTVAQAMQIPLHDDIKEKTIEKIIRLNYDATSSMHRDFQKGGRTEYISLTYYIIKEAAGLNIPVPAFTLISDKLDRTG
jgi:2-dehydropantoate 2-reductase